MGGCVQGRRVCRKIVDAYRKAGEPWVLVDELDLGWFLRVTEELTQSELSKVR